MNELNDFRKDLKPILEIKSKVDKAYWHKGLEAPIKEDIRIMKTMIISLGKKYQKEMK